METKLTIKELSQVVLDELEKMNYAYNSICGFRASFNRIIAFADELGETHFTEELGNEYLLQKYDCAVNYYLEAAPRKAKCAIRSIRLLGDYQLHGIIVRRIVKKKGYIKPPQFEQVLTAYENECRNNQYSLRGMRTKVQRLYFFIDYLALRKINNVDDINAEVISNYLKTICHHHEKSMAAILTTLRVFLRFVFVNGYSKDDLSLLVPKQKKYYYPPIPSTWDPGEVKRMLESIDRGNPAGKRNYAILLLVAKLGIRAGDIKAMKLSSLDWKSLSISIVQEKTGARITYPIFDDIGWALIDYIKNGRPKFCESPYLFLRLTAPYEPFGENANMHNIITKYTRKANISVPRGKRHGLHSLRHSLASSLLANGASLPVITEILGHMDPKSTAIYLRTDINRLKECALNPDEVYSDEE